MRRVEEVIVVEGKYDKIHLGQIVDAVIIATDGFRLYKNKDRLALIRRLAQKSGVIILTDSDHAGFRLRSHLKQALGEGIHVRHAYIPELPGKERRKRQAGAEGLLGVEGIPPALILEALDKACATPKAEGEPVTKADFYALGLGGTAGCGENRRRVCRRLGLPEKLSANALLEAVNALHTRAEFFALMGAAGERKEKEW